LNVVGKADFSERARIPAYRTSRSESPGNRAAQMKKMMNNEKNAI
jgi:hypothetical protein